MRRSIHASLLLLALAPGMTLAAQQLAGPGAGPTQVVQDWKMSVNGRVGQSLVRAIPVEGDVCLDAPTIAQWLGIGFHGEDSGTISAAFFGRRFVGRMGEALAHPPGGGDLALPCAPFSYDGFVFLPLRALAESFGMRVTIGERRVDVSVAPASVLSVRYSEDDDRFRTVVDLAEPTPFFAVASESVISIGLVTAGGFVPPNAPATKRGSRGELTAVGPPPLIRMPFQGILGSEVTVENLDHGFVRISAHGNYGVAEPQVTTMAGPARIILDFPKRWQKTTSSDVTGGLAKTWYSIGTPSGPVIAHVALADIGPGGKLRPRVVLAGSASRSRAPLSAIAAASGAVLGVNGGYFAPDWGDPIGLVVVDGEWVRLPYANRTALLVLSDGSVAIGNMGAQAEVAIGGRRVGVSGLNEWLPESGECVKVITRRWGGSWPCVAGQVCITVRQGTVASVAAPTGRVDVAPPSDGFLIVGSGGGTVRALAAMPVGTQASFAAGLQPQVPGVVSALGGGPRIVAGGRVCDTSHVEQFLPDIWSGRSPRTAVGITASGDLLLATVDGRQAGFSIGMTIAELGSLMARLGAVDAMALDSGGSAEMVVMGKVQNRPSDGQERPIPDALVLVPAG